MPVSTETAQSSDSRKVSYLKVFAKLSKTINAIIVLFTSYVHFGQAIYPPEVVRCYPEADPDNNPAHHGPVRSPRYHTPKVTAHQPTYRHRHSVSPIHQALGYERHHRYTS